MNARDYAMRFYCTTSPTAPVVEAFCDGAAWAQAASQVPLYEDELPDGYPYDEMFPYSWVDIVRLFPSIEFVRGYLACTNSILERAHQPGTCPESQADREHADKLITNIESPSPSTTKTKGTGEESST